MCALLGGLTSQALAEGKKSDAKNDQATVEIAKADFNDGEKKKRGKRELSPACKADAEKLCTSEMSEGPREVMKCLRDQDEAKITVECKAEMEIQRKRRESRKRD
mgnify:FL=1